VLTSLLSASSCQALISLSVAESETVSAATGYRLRIEGGDQLSGLAVPVPAMSIACVIGEVR